MLQSALFYQFFAKVLVAPLVVIRLPLLMDNFSFNFTSNVLSDYHKKVDEYKNK